MGRKATARERPGRMLYAVKIKDHHLGEQQLIEMAVFYYAATFYAYS